MSESDRFPRLAFRTPHDAAANLREAAITASGEHLRLLPFNPFDPDNSEWWLSPSPDNPAFKHGKIILMNGPSAAPADLFVGFYVEKGIGERAAPAFMETAKGRRLVMADDWQWRHLAGALESGAFTAAATSAEARAGLPLMVGVDGGPLSPPSPGWDYNPHGLIGWDAVRFESSGGTLGLLDSDLRVGSLAGLENAMTFEELAVAMELVPDPDWVWLDFYIGLRLAIDDGTGGTIWSFEDLWRRGCDPWRNWLE